jgi:hypothetical protein
LVGRSSRRMIMTNRRIWTPMLAALAGTLAAVMLVAV